MAGITGSKATLGRVRDDKCSAAIYLRQLFPTSEMHKHIENIGDIELIMSN
jgi:hypothetical protein